MQLLRNQGRAAAALLAWRREAVGTRFRGEKEFLQVGSGHTLHSAPLPDREEHGGLHTSLGDDLRPLGKGSIQEFTEPHLGVLNRPFPAHGTPPGDFLLTDYQTRLYGYRSQGR